MEDPKSTDEDDQFFDVPDEFPFYDCPEDFQSSDYSSSPPQSSLSLSSRSPASEGLRRRRFPALHERNRKFRQDLRDLENVEKNEGSTVTIAEENGEDVRENDDAQFSFLVFLAELLVKSVGFQFNLLVSLITFPFWALYYTFVLVLNPLYILRLSRNYLTGKLLRLWNSVNPFLSEWIKEHKSLMKFGLRFGWGIFWSVFVGSILVALLILAFVISGLMVRYYLVEEPFNLNQGLNFDYTKSRPVAFVPITACPTMESTEYNEFRSAEGVRVIPRGYKLQTTVMLVLPESDYNRNLGIFQVRVDFLSENGKSLASLSHPCMLEFRSEPIRLLLTFFKIIPLVAGYVSESQTLRLKLRGYTENFTPTACLRVTIEQRAEYRAGAGIPEVYNAFLLIESNLPFFKRILWH